MSDDVDIVVTLHALATYAENANHWTDDKRMMDASGVADTIYEAMDRIEELEAERHVFVAAVSEAARARGEAEGRLEASEAAGVLEGWIEKCAALEAKLAKAVEDCANVAKRMADEALTPAAREHAEQIAEAILAELTGDKDE